VIKINFKKLLIGIIGSACCYLLINNFIVSLPIWKYLVIETIITLSHYVYEHIKKTTDLEE